MRVFFKTFGPPMIYMMLSSIVSLLTVFSPIAFVVGLVSLLIAVDAFVLTSVWPIVIPKLFPALVAQGVITGSVNFYTMFWALTAIMVLRPINVSNIFQKTPKTGEKR